MATLVSRDTTDTFAVRKGEVRECPERRTRAFKVFELPPEKDGRKRFRVGGQIGPVHYRLDPERETEVWKDIDLALVPQKSGPWDWACITNGYQVHVANRLRLNGQGLLYAAQFRRLGAWLRMAPLALAWENAAGERQEIGQPQADIEPQVEDGGIEWRDCFGKGLHYRYNLHPDRFFKTLVVESAEALPKPTIGGRGLRLTLTLAWAWSRDAGPQEFARGQRVEALPTAVEARVPDEERSDPGLYPHKREERDCFWVREPQAWDSAEEPSRWPVAMRLRRYGGGVCADFSLGAQEFVGACYPLMVDTDISEEQVGASSDDASVTGASNAWSLTATVVRLNHATEENCCGFRWTTVPITAGATIDSASFAVEFTSTTFDDPQATIYANDVDNAVTFSTVDDTPAGRAKTTATATWQETGIGTGWKTSPSISSVVQEVVDREGWAANNGLAVITYAISVSAKYGRFRTYDADSRAGAKFNCSYTEAASGTVYEVEGDALAFAFADGIGSSLSFLLGDGAAAGSAEAYGTPIGFLSGDALARADAEAQPSAVLNATADAGAGAGAEGAAMSLHFATGDAAATGAAEATVTRILLAAGDAQATGAAEAAATRVVLLCADAAAQADAEASATLTHGATGDAAARGDAEAASSVMLLIAGDAVAQGGAKGTVQRTINAAGDGAATGNAEAAATIAHLLCGDAFAAGATEAQATHLIYAVGDAAATAGAEAQAALLLIVTGDAAASAYAEAQAAFATNLNGDASASAGADGALSATFALIGDAQGIGAADEARLVYAIRTPLAVADVQRLIVEATALTRTGIGAAQLSRDELSAESLATLRVIADELRRHGINVDLL